MGGCVVHLVTGPFCQPSLDLCVFVGGVIIDNQMHVEVGGYVSVNVPEKGQEFLMPVTALTAAQDGAGGHVQSGKQRSGPVSDVVVRHPLDVAQSPAATTAMSVPGPGFGSSHRHTGPRHGREGSDISRRYRSPFR